MNIYKISSGHFYGHSTTGLTTFFAKIKRGLKRNSLLMLNKKLVEMTNEQLQQFYLNSRELLNF